MKKSAYLLALLLGLSSCNYLDIEPAGQVIPDKTSAYRALLTEGYFRFPYFNSRAYTGLLSDEIGTFNDGIIYDSEASVELPYNYTWQYGNQFREYPYQEFYRAIFIANALIADVLTARPDSSESNEQLLSEAYALRAYSFFNLVNLYGAPYDPATAETDRTVPLATGIDIEQKYRPSTVAAVYRLILADIAESEKTMEVEKQPQDYNYRFSKDAVAAFKARVMLYTGSWQEALDAATPLMEKYGLVDFNGTLDKDNNLVPLPEKDLPWKGSSPEAILAWERPFSGAGNDLKDASGISDPILALFGEARDNRRDFIKEAVKVDPIWGDETPLGYQIVVRSTSDRTSIRTAEIYLIAAEASAHLPGALADAKTYLLKLQEKRFKTDAMDAQRSKVEAMDQAALLAEIADERARELLLEGHRWFDLRRTTRPAIIKNHKGDQYLLNARDSRYTLPFPQSAINNNPELAN